MLFRNKSIIKHIFFIAMLTVINSCSDDILEPEKQSVQENKNFKLTLKIDPDIVYLNSVSKVTVSLERLAHKDSISSVTMSMKMDAVGGTLDVHTYGIISTSSFSVTSIDDLPGSRFDVLASFVPTSTYSSSSGGYYYNYKDNGLITASFNGLNVSLPIKLVVPR